MTKILWLEDYEDLTDALSVLFEVKGFGVRVCHTSHEFLSIVADFIPDVIIVDIKLKGSKDNGFEVLEKLQNSVWSMIPAIVFSGYIMPAYMQRAKDLGAKEYVLKPVRFAQLLAAVERALATRTSDPQT
jgi:two-component system, NtrC family, nitrogen regulation response regulator NtrX